MKKIIAFMHVSLDGFVAGPNGALNWINVNEQIFDYIGERISKNNTALYGRVTYEMMENYWPTAGDRPSASKHDIQHAKWYKNAHKVVFSNTLQEADLANATIISNHLSDRLAEIKQQPGGDEILLFGSPTATHSLIQQNLIDGYWLFVNPVILGQGMRLFPNLKTKLN